MKKDYIKPCICVDAFEVRTSILEGSLGESDNPPRDTDARSRYGYGLGDKRNQRGYGSYGSRNTGWGSLW